MESSAEHGQGPWQATVLTLFPEMFPGPLGQSIPDRAQKQGLWSLETVDIRAYATDRHRSVDDVPFGGGAGMVMRADVVDRALTAMAGRPGPVYYLSPRGRVFTQTLARHLATTAGIVLLCGRYEGLDQRVIDQRGLEELSLGDFVLSGGEPAAMAVIDAVVRLLPGVVGSDETLREESFNGVLLEYPHYTRPRSWQGRAVPEVLLSGHHDHIQRWRLRQAEAATRERRPDLWARYQEKKQAGEEELP